VSLSRASIVHVAVQALPLWQAIVVPTGLLR
jgi:hypothetical protein